MTWTITLPEAAGVSLVVSILVNAVISRLRRRSGPKPEPDPRAEDVAWDLERERYEAIVEELHDCPERWPEWVRGNHRARAVDLLAASVLTGGHGQMLWEAGNELGGLLAVDDANRMREQGLRMLEEAGPE